MAANYTTEICPSCFGTGLPRPKHSGTGTAYYDADVCGKCEGKKVIQVPIPPFVPQPRTILRPSNQEGAEK